MNAPVIHGFYIPTNDPLWRAGAEHQPHENSIICGVPTDRNLIARFNEGVTCANCKRLASLRGVVL